MFKELNKLKPFMEDCYKQFSVREYARTAKMSPATASKYLNRLCNENILVKDSYRNYILFSANKESHFFINLSRLYWLHTLEKSGLFEYFNRTLVNPTVILFGSLSKAEAKTDSDIDLAILAGKKNMDVNIFEKKLGRKIQLFLLDSINAANKELRNNIVNGFIINGRLKL